MTFQNTIDRPKPLCRLTHSQKPSGIVQSARPVPARVRTKTSPLDRSIDPSLKTERTFKNAARVRGGRDGPGRDAGFQRERQWRLRIPSSILKKWSKRRRQIRRDGWFERTRECPVALFTTLPTVVRTGLETVPFDARVVFLTDFFLSFFVFVCWKIRRRSTRCARSRGGTAARALSSLYP